MGDVNISVVGQGYAGYGDGLNNPDMQNVENTGPLPEGVYMIGKQQDNKTGNGTLLRGSMRLTPTMLSRMFKRNGFLMHRGNMTKKNSSKGCIVQTEAALNAVGASNDKTLVVVQ